MNDQPLQGQSALVTGASRGIGAAIARALAAAGAKVALNYQGSHDACKKECEQIRADGGEAVCVQADVSRESDVKSMFAQAIDAFGTLDILVNNAGIQRESPFADTTLEDWQAVLGVNLTGQFLCSREAVREFLRRGKPTDGARALGKIVCVSSVHETIPWAGYIGYAASKGGVGMLMRTMAQELAEKRIRVNGIAPGAIATDINRPAWETQEARSELLELIPYGRVGDAEDIGKAAVWLASDDSDYVTGATLYVDGGMKLYPAFRSGG